MLVYPVLSTLLTLHLRSVLGQTPPVQVPVPAKPTQVNVVFANFLGISYELSFLDRYFGSDTDHILQPMVNYLKNLRARTGNTVPVRLRIGGNSMDSSVYMADQKAPLLKLTNPNANANDQPVEFGKLVWEVLRDSGKAGGGAEYLIGVALTKDNDPAHITMASDAKAVLGDALDAFLLGNEPDLYTAHQKRPTLQNYTVADYTTEFRTTTNSMKSAPGGDLLSQPAVGGPTICCAWDLATFLQEGYLSNFGGILKYLSLQHYPQNNCQGKPAYGLSYYLDHTNVKNLAAWQQHGLDIFLASPNRPKLVLSEFNSASCGGVPGISDTFAAGGLWIADYALQLSTRGYDAAYVHTREGGITYNLFDPTDDTGAKWKTNAAYYALLAVSETLQLDNGGYVNDLNLTGKFGGYAVYDSKSSVVARVVLFNYADGWTPFFLPKTVLPAGAGSMTVKYLSANSSTTENNRISWGGQTLFTTTDGTLVDSSEPWVIANRDVHCTDQCQVDVPPQTMAVVFVNGQTSYTTNSIGTPSISPSPPGSSVSRTDTQTVGQPTSSGNGQGSGTKEKANAALRMGTSLPSFIIALCSMLLFM